VEVGVGVKLARDQIVQLSGTRGKHKCQAIDKGVNQPDGSNGIRCAVDVVYGGHG
jgi:hypothetical protein